MTWLRNLLVKARPARALVPPPAPVRAESPEDDEDEDDFDPADVEDSDEVLDELERVDDEKTLRFAKGVTALRDWVGKVGFDEAAQHIATKKDKKGQPFGPERAKKIAGKLKGMAHRAGTLKPEHSYSPEVRARAKLQKSTCLLKATGEGSRGGHVIGHTRGGKPVYGPGHGPKGEAFLGHPNEAMIHHRINEAAQAHGYTPADHADAREAHIKEYRRLRQTLDRPGIDRNEGWHEANAKASTHWDAALHHARAPQRDKPAAPAPAADTSDKAMSKVVGQTRSGKAAVLTPGGFSPTTHVGFTPAEHEEAAQLHRQAMKPHRDRMHELSLEAIKHRGERLGRPYFTRDQHLRTELRKMGKEQEYQHHEGAERAHMLHEFGHRDEAMRKKHELNATARQRFAAEDVARTRLPMSSSVADAGVAEQHRARVAAQTARMPEAMRGVMGGDIKKGILNPGSRGGKVVGTTKSGRPIYLAANEAEHERLHKRFSAPEHDEARDLHLAHAKEGGALADAHLEAAAHHRRSRNEKRTRVGLLGRAGAAMRSVFDTSALQADFAKAKKGEGSRGGKVVGHRKSGKPIYQGIANTRQDEARRIGHTRSGKAVYHPAYHRGPGGKGFSPELADHYASFSAEDHADAAALHEKRAASVNALGLNARAPGEAERAAHHRDSARMVEHEKRTGRSLIDEAKDEPFKKAVGEGSRGGKVVGHTKTGKPVYLTENHADWQEHHRHFTAAEHAEAMSVHHEASAGMKPGPERRPYSEHGMKHADAIMHGQAAPEPPKTDLRAVAQKQLAHNRKQQGRLRRVGEAARTAGKCRHCGTSSHNPAALKQHEENCVEHPRFREAERGKDRSPTETAVHRQGLTQRILAAHGRASARQGADREAAETEAARQRANHPAVKAARKAELDRQPAPSELPQDHGRYFHHPPGTEHVPLEKLHHTKGEHGDEAVSSGRAAKSMRMAYDGKGEKRAPITVRHRGDGHYDVTDGNATLHAARRHGWTSLPVQHEAAAEKPIQKAVHTLALPSDCPGCQAEASA